jgi:hypothetical protein
MKKLILFVITVSVPFFVNAEVTKTIYSKAGTLFSKMTDTELSTVTDLILTGTIDARDFVTIRDKMIRVKRIDLSNAYISYYTGIDGTTPFNIQYPANAIQVNAFINNNFVSKTSLTTISLPNSLTSIGVCAFCECKGLISVHMPKSVTTIGDGAFQGCSGLTGKLIIPDSVTSIKNCAFQGCKSLTAVSIPHSVTSIGDQAFGGCSGLTSLTIPQSVTTIGNSAFAVCTGLTNLSIPKSVIFIDAQAFWGCIGLTTIIANSKLPINLSTSYQVFSNVNKTTCTLYVPNGSKIYYTASNQWQDFLNTVEMPATISTVNNSNTNSLYLLTDHGIKELESCSN